MATSAISLLEQKMAPGSQVLDPGVILQMLYLTLMNKLDCTVMTYFLSACCHYMSAAEGEWM